ncbi:MAG: peptidase T [Crocinitomicaceae bacterium]|nr:peptidase T [Crocinitomicaceae bacterium]MDG1735104.1 peptidase T [Crocinitomicaceae bacterium]MDG2506434.1 peptidase T [Crocinitomicaceae bacterium]
MNYKHTVEERFIRYAKIDTTADPTSTTFPSSEIQKNLGRLLVSELQDLGAIDVEMDKWGYVFGTIPSNSLKENIPTICFCSHMDTAPDCSGTNVKPLVHRNYQGAPIVLPDDPTQIITKEKQKYLQGKLGDDIITASGETLLGADDKAGIAIIMDFAKYMIEHPQYKHGDIRILFTPDEEIGKGVDHLDMKKLNADFGYTLDGGPEGSIEDESFSADGMKVTIEGLSAHPGYAKGKMVNAIKMAALLVDSLPKNNLTPETTSHREGFIHPYSIEGALEKASVEFIIRDHDTSKLSEYESLIANTMKTIADENKGITFNIEITEQYRNMKEILNEYPEVCEYAGEAMQKAGIKPVFDLIRGGTDGSRMSFMGMPCPNIFTGEMAIHSRQEYVVVQDMEKSVKTLVELIQIWEQRHE